MTLVQTARPTLSLLNDVQIDRGNHESIVDGIIQGKSSLEIITPELVRRSVDSLSFRESLICDPHLTCRACLSDTLGQLADLSSELRIVVLEDRHDLINLIIAQSDQIEASDSLLSDPISQTLRNAQDDVALRESLVKNPRGTLEMVCLQKYNTKLSIPNDLEIIVRESSFDEFAIVLPPRVQDRISQSELIDIHFPLKLDEPLAVQTDPCDSRAFTMCRPSCGL